MLEDELGNSGQSADHRLTNTNKPRYVLALYVTGATPKSTRAIANLHAICEMHLKDSYDLEVIDIYQQPERARTEMIIATPTLVKHLPEPMRKLVGDMSDTARVLVGLGVA